MVNFDTKGYSKCLISGGYAVVFEGQRGLVLQTNDYYETEITVEKSEEFSVKITSLQYTNKPTFKYKFDQGVFIEVKETPINPFIKAVLQVCSKYFPLEELKKFFEEKSVCLDVYFTSRYINKIHQTGKILKGSYPEFEGDYNSCSKTGLGSSSSLIITLLKSLFSVFGDYQKDKIHICGQVANYLAQNKIGSGFDISCSVYGSCEFTRIPSSIIIELVESVKEEFSEKIEKVAQMVDLKNIDIENRLNVLFLEWNDGFDTRIAVQKVLGHFAQDSEDKTTFLEKSNFFNDSLLHELQKSQLDLTAIKQLNQNYRELMKSTGTKSQVQIEPDTASVLIEYFLKKYSQDLIYGICPGAGGYDAIAFLSVNPQFQLDPVIHSDINEVLAGNEFLAEFQISDFNNLTKNLNINILQTDNVNLQEPKERDPQANIQGEKPAELETEQRIP